jgi:hypothetical protein
MSWIEAENAFRLICHAWKTEKQLYRISIRYIARNTIAQQMILYPVHPCFRLVSETTLIVYTKINRVNYIRSFFTPSPFVFFVTFFERNSYQLYIILSIRVKR